MRFRLCKKDNIVLLFEAILTPTFLNITKIDIINRDKLPLRLQQKSILTDKDLEDWIGDRCISNMNPDLDEICIRLLNIKNKHIYGRMFGYQYILSLMSYCASWFDDYYISPVGTAILLWGMYDSNFDTLFELNEKSWDNVNRLRENPATELDNCISRKDFSEAYYTYNSCYNTLSLSIPTIRLTYFREINGISYLCQDVTDIINILAETDLSEDISAYGSRYEYRIPDLKYKTTRWISDYLDIRKPQEHHKNQLEWLRNMFVKEFGQNQAIQELIAELENIMPYFTIDPRLCGISRKGNGDLTKTIIL